MYNPQHQILRAMNLKFNMQESIFHIQNTKTAQTLKIATMYIGNDFKIECIRTEKLISLVAILK